MGGVSQSVCHTWSHSIHPPPLIDFSTSPLWAEGPGMGTDNTDKMDLGADATSVGLKASSADAEKTSVSYAVQVGEQQALAKSGQLEGALQNLLALEKPARLVRAW